MTIEKAIEDALKASADVQALVADRIYYGEAPEGTAMPYLVHQEISNPKLVGVPFYRPRWQFSSWAKRLDQAKELARVVRDLFHLYKGILGGVTVRLAVYEDIRPYRDPAADAWNAPCDVFFIHQEEP